ncbi:MAG: hypothetical protein ABSB56_07820 [Nitrososphaerales archaeon]
MKSKKLPSTLVVVLMLVLSVAFAILACDSHVKWQPEVRPKQGGGRINPMAVGSSLAHALPKKYGQM